jgi:hypothetical protein
VQDNVQACARIMELKFATIMNILADMCCEAAAVLIDEETLVTKKYDKWALYTLQHDLYTVGKVRHHTHYTLLLLRSLHERFVLSHTVGIQPILHCSMRIQVAD